MKKRVVFGLPITPIRLIEQLAGQSFCVSFGTRSRLGRQLDDAIRLVDKDGILLVDNGAYSAWRSGAIKSNGLFDDDFSYWDKFAYWAADLLKRCPQAVVVLPDVIDGDEASNDALMDEFTAQANLGLGLKIPMERTMPVWHLHESLDRLKRMVASGYSYLAFGSSGQYAKCGTPEWHDRIKAAFAAIDEECSDGGEVNRRPWIHMMRAQSFADQYDFDSSDSCNVAVNHCYRKKDGEGHVQRMAERIANRIHASCTMQERGIDRPGDMGQFDVDLFWEQVRELEASMNRKVVAA
jgi:hypothetical protein